MESEDCGTRFIMWLTSIWNNSVCRFPNYMAIKASAYRRTSVLQSGYICKSHSNITCITLLHNVKAIHLSALSYYMLDAVFY